ncbi:NADH dehydrogenase subunit D [Syntrophus gentianae]|uniref:NADH-quinone oxidoreductase subunit D n=1 Tax=Syntrophus gentianae TaxID=43775 RepID=A0A1H7ZIS9_9BACT|nr:NADH-quinone oxidoreductase subunit D [Syntrophus gentianae]SEM58320.1 NADH dehydrogenase subunit D [Syntrophus gentianae]
MVETDSKLPEERLLRGKTETMEVNFGPQHPSTHGVFRAVVELDGETVVKVVPHLGFLHRGIEKLAEHRTYSQIIPLTDRLDYMAGASNNLGYCLAVEKLLKIEAPPRGQFIRVILTELSRISSHLFWAGANAHDLGAMTPFFYMCREREQILFLLERATGARLTPSFFRIGGVALDLPPEFADECHNFVEAFPGRVDEYETLLTENPIWKSRTQGVGYLPAKDCIALGVSGPMARASGINWDLRKDMPYSGYEKFYFQVPVYSGCDAYDRYRVRIMEMRQSCEIVRQALEGLPEGEHSVPVKANLKPPAGEVYMAIEAPRGELGFYLVSDGSASPYRLKIRPPTFVNLQAFPRMSEGGLFSDMVAALSSIDLVLAEVDR